LVDSVPISPRQQVSHIRIRVSAGSSKGTPVVDCKLREGRVVLVALREADASDVAEVEGEVAGCGRRKLLVKDKSQ